MRFRIGIIVCVIGLLAVGCGKQAENSTVAKNDSSVHPVSDTVSSSRNKNAAYLIARLNQLGLTEKKTVQEIPAFIISHLEKLDSEFSMANPGEDWASGCSSFSMVIEKVIYKKINGDSIPVTVREHLPPRPRRQLVYFGSRSNVAVLVYHTGGVYLGTHAMIIQLTGTKILTYRDSEISFDKKGIAFLADDVIASTK